MINVKFLPLVMSVLKVTKLICKREIVQNMFVLITVMFVLILTLVSNVLLVSPLINTNLVHQ